MLASVSEGFTTNYCSRSSEVLTSDLTKEALVVLTKFLERVHRMAKQLWLGEGLSDSFTQWPCQCHVDSTWRKINTIPILQDKVDGI